MTRPVLAQLHYLIIHFTLSFEHAFQFLLLIRDLIIENAYELVLLRQFLLDLLNHIYLIISVFDLFLLLLG